MHEQEHETDLLRKIGEDDENAFNQLYRQFAPSIYNAVMLYAKQEDLAREIVQIVFVKVWEKRAMLVGVRSIEDYLFIMARNLLFTHFKKSMREGKLMLFLGTLQENSVADSSHRVETRQYDELLKEAINRLSPQQKLAYELFKQEGLSYEEISAEMQISRNTVRKHIELANRFVRNYVNGRLHYFVLSPLVLFSVGMLG